MKVPSGERGATSIVNGDVPGSNPGPLRRVAQLVEHLNVSPLPIPSGIFSCGADWVTSVKIFCVYQRRFWFKSRTLARVQT